MCNKRIKLTEECANNHYRSVIRVFIHDALELTEFLNEAAAERFQVNLRKLQSNVNGRLSLSTSNHLDNLDIDDWVSYVCLGAQVCWIAVFKVCSASRQNVVKVLNFSLFLIFFNQLSKMPLFEEVMHGLNGRANVELKRLINNLSKKCRNSY